MHDTEVREVTHERQTSRWVKYESVLSLRPMFERMSGGGREGARRDLRLAVLGDQASI